jgi:hypothetical protein
MQKDISLAFGSFVSAEDSVARSSRGYRPPLRKVTWTSFCRLFFFRPEGGDPGAGRGAAGGGELGGGR